MKSAILFFVLVNIARYLSLDPESALRKTNRKFRRRFEYLEERLREQGRKPADASLDEDGIAVAGIEAAGKSVSDCDSSFAICTDARGVPRLCRVAEGSVGLQRSRTGAAAHLLARAQDRRPGDRRLGRRHDWWALRFRFPASATDATYLHSHMLAVKDELSQHRPGTAPEAVSARRRHRARLRADGVDLRSAGDQERLLQPGAAGRDRATLQHQSVRHHVVAAARISADRPPGRRVVAEVEARRESCLRQGEHLPFQPKSCGSKCPPRSTRGRPSRRRGRRRPRCNCAIASSFCRRLRTGCRVWATAVTMTATESFCLGAGTRTGRIATKA